MTSIETMLTSKKKNKGWAANSTEGKAVYGSDII